MKKPYFSIVILFLFLSILTGKAFSQNIEPEKHCGHTEMYNKLISRHPEILQQERLDEIQTEQYISSAQNSGRQGTIYVIPVVFHVLHQYGDENISDAQILDAVRIFNEDFSGSNADTSDVVPEFKNLIGNAEIEFRLAQKDPNGNATNGIDRIVTDQTNIGDDDSKLNQWPRNQYLNIWVVKTISSGAAGYAYYPSGASSWPEIDGIMILNNYVGSIGTSSPGHSRALVHEIGHYLNLQHVWGSTNDPGVACGNDAVSDTPVTMGWTSCMLSQSKNCNANIVENIQNIMEYAYCQLMFTKGQVTRMRAALNSSTSGRNNLWTSSNLAATGVNTPIADFTPKATIITCQGNNVQFNDVSYNGAITNRTWAFQGGSPSSGTSKTMDIVYSNPGVYDVSLDAGNANGSSSKTRPAKIIVLDNVNSLTTQYSQNFEDATSVSNDIKIINDEENNFKFALDNNGYNGGKCLKLDNFSQNNMANIDGIVLPVMNFSGVNNIKMTFRVAYRTINENTTDAIPNSEDQLKVSVSTNCGENWTSRYTKSGTTLSTVSGPTTTVFIPSSTTEWRQETVSFPSTYAKDGVLIKFEFTSGYGNNIYIDDINFTYSTLLNQTITFNTLPTKVVGDADFAPGAIASSGLAVSYTSSNTSVATIVNGNIHIVGAGTSTITASQSGNSSYAAASSVSQTLTTNANGLSEYLANEFKLQIAPNPANGNFKISFDLAEASSNATIAITDVLGREVCSLHKGKLNAGQNEFSVSESNLNSSGIYFVNLKLDGKLIAKKVVIN